MDSSVANYGVVRLALDYLKGRKVSAAGVHPAAGVQIWIAGLIWGAVGGWDCGINL